MIKQQLIMEKALELFAIQGFDATSVQQITDHCGISKGAFYLSFKSKDELIIALIDYFMKQIISEIDHLVRNTKDDSQLLYNLYYATFNYFGKHANFAKFFMKEQTQSFNQELIQKVRYYDQLNDRTIMYLIERVYGDKVKHTKYDIILCIKALMKTYSELLLFYNTSLDLSLLAKSLAEKTDLLVKHTTVPFITDELVKILQQPLCEEVSRDGLLEILDQTIDEIDEYIEKESLIMLRDHIVKPSLHPAVLQGLLENIRNHTHCKWISYLLRSYCLK